MSYLTRRIAHFCQRFFRGEQVERELDDEVRTFFEIRIERYVARGLSQPEALRQARLEFEGPEQIKEKVRQERRGMVIETALRDIRYAWRTLRKNPGFTAIAVLTLGLGIGANTAIFSLIHAVMLRLLPVQHPEQLVLLTDPSESGVAEDTTESGVQSMLSYPEFEQLHANNTVFSGMLAAQSDVSDIDVFRGLSPAAQPLKAHSQLVSGNFFEVLGVQAVRGRTFTVEEDRAPGASPVAVVSYGYWKRQFSGDPNILGSTIRVGNGVFRILGVTPPTFHGILVGSDTDFWFPLTMQAQVLPGKNYLTPRDTLWLQAMGRLLPGISLKAAQAGINTTFQQALRDWAGAAPTVKERRNLLNQKIQLRAGARGASELRGQFSDPLLLLMAMVGVVLLIACANLGNLMLARASGRQREIGVRLALGAARLRLIRQLLTESLLIAALGGGLAIFLSAVGTRLLLALVSTGVSNLDLSVRADYPVLLFTAAISLLTGLLFGLAPAIRGTRLDVNRTLAANARSSLGSRGRVQTGKILGMAQVALSLILLMGAGLFVRSLHNMLAQKLGYDRDHLLMISVDPVAAGYKGQSAREVYEQIREELLTLPGVRNASLSNSFLFTGDSGDHLAIEGSPERDPAKLAARWTEVGPDYFSTLKIPLLRGREINTADAERATPVCVINQSFLRRFFPDGDAIGKHITDRYPTTRETFEIVGVAADVKEHSPDEKIEPRFYANLSHPIGKVESITFLLNTSGAPANVAFEARKLLQQYNRNLPILAVRSIDQQLERRLITQSLVADLATFFGALALLMAAIGLYGLMSFSISQRTNEIGIRMALGASAASVLRMALGETLWMVAIGVAVGLPCGIAASRVIASRLYGLSAADPISIAISLFTVLACALLAGYVPARRASRIDPMQSLRHH